MLYFTIKPTLNHLGYQTDHLPDLTLTPTFSYRHLDDTIDPVRDVQTVTEELIQRDLSWIDGLLPDMIKANDKQKNKEKFALAADRDNCHPNQN